MQTLLKSPFLSVPGTIFSFDELSIFEDRGYIRSPGNIDGTCFETRNAGKLLIAFTATPGQAMMMQFKSRIKSHLVIDPEQIALELENGDFCIVSSGIDGEVTIV